MYLYIYIYVHLITYYSISHNVCTYFNLRDDWGPRPTGQVRGDEGHRSLPLWHGHISQAASPRPNLAELAIMDMFFMDIYIYVCVCVSIYIYICIYIYIFMYIYYPYVYIYIYTPHILHICRNIQTYMCIHICIYIYNLCIITVYVCTYVYILYI